ncbi:putative disease resistance protein RGA4 isoform X2 [Triticum dicoccoides]|uniref:putative disease resistance protein RGA4 isoform X2 n=1 Tax=Triticum dicoccoides TaxID=85692 RepID=UPI000E78DD8F|nr:putative disease resistance protein RGA4 isoform X2 [Triticum dicoccoides]
MSLSAIGIVSAINDCVTLFQWAKSAISSLHSRWSGSEEQSLQDRVLQLESGLQLLRDTLPAMHDLINKAEWRSHEHGVAKLLAYLKDAVSEAEDLLDEFTWYEKKVQVEGDTSRSPFIEFFETVVLGSFNKLNAVQLRLNHLSVQLDNIGLRGVTQHFDKLVRPETTSLPNEREIFGRDKELKQVLGFLNVPANLKRKRATSSISASTSASASNHVDSESRIMSLPVLPIVGIGGVGKTTLAQHICSHHLVKSQFEKIIWICVSDDFDVKRLTEEAIQSCIRNAAPTDNLDPLKCALSNNNLDSLQHALSKHVNNKRLLIVLDDMWDDSLKENGQCWRRFCAPFTSVQEGSVMLVTTRCPNVSKGVGTMEPIIVEGLNDDIFWKFFKLCAFGSEGSNNDPELERIGRSILPKLKGSPLAAKTLGRMLSMDLQALHWNSILDSELWELKQKETEILPALRLSYMYLPFYLKQCFAFCAVYPKDYIFEKARLAEIWVAEGFVEPHGHVPIQDIGYQYFEDLVARSFFQKVNDGYVIHDLLHDMAQKVSEHDCFILRNKSDFDKVPLNVHHLYVISSSNFDDSYLLRLCKYTKLHTLICMKNLGGETGYLMDQWCTKLLHMRVFSCAFTNELPDSIGNWKHLRYLEISGVCSLKRIPSTFCWLYNVQILYVKGCNIESLPSGFDKLINLQKFESHGLKYYVGGRSTLHSAVGLMKNLNQFHGHLEVSNFGFLSKDHAAEAELKNKKDLDQLTLRVHSERPQTIRDNEIELLQNMQPPISLKYIFLQNYAGVSLPSWFQPRNLPDLKSLRVEGCVGLESISFPMITQSINTNVIPTVGIFLSLTDVTIHKCENISSIEHFLHPDYVPAIKKIRILYCKMLASATTEKFGDFHFLEELQLVRCPNICSQRMVSPSLKKLSLWGSGLFNNIECCSLTYFLLKCDFVISIQLQMWSLPALWKLHIECISLTSIEGSANLSISTDTGSITTFSSLNELTITRCDKLSTLDDLLTQEYLPAIEYIHVECCRELLSLPGERFGSFPYLRNLVVIECQSLNWQRGLVFPSSLQRLRV